MSLPHVQSNHHKYNDELESLNGHTGITTTTEGDTVLLLSEPATRELEKFLESRMDVVRGEQLKALHNISVGIMNRFAFDYGSSIKLSLLRERVGVHPDEWRDRTTHEPRNTDAWTDVVETVTSEW